MIYLLLAWYFTAVWLLLSLLDKPAQWLAAILAVMLGPFYFPVAFLVTTIVSEKRKWELNNYYRDRS